MPMSSTSLTKVVLIIVASALISPFLSVAAQSVKRMRPVYSDIQMLSIVQIDGVQQTYRGDFFLSLIYEDH